MSAVKRLLGLAAQDFPHALQPDFLDRSARLAAGPGVEGAELGDQRGPVGFRERSLVAEERLDRGGLQCGQRASPGRVDPLREGQRVVCSHLCEGETGDVRVRGGQVFGPQREEFLLIAIQRVDRARIESGQAAAGKVVLHFHFDRFDGGGRRLGVRTERQQRGVAFRLLPPIGVRRRIGEELVHLGLADARFAARVGVRPEARNDVVDDRLGGLVAGGVGGHDAVAVERLGREGLGRCGRFLNGNLR